MIEEHERRHKYTFTAVLSARPDLLWYRAMLPWCFLDLTSQTHRLHSDWAYLMPRQSARAIMKWPHAAYTGCSKDFNGSMHSIESWLDE